MLYEDRGNGVACIQVAPALNPQLFQKYIEVFEKLGGH